MIDDKTILAVVPARGGSKGIPRKNIRNLAGKPLIAWTIEEAKKCPFIDRLILSSEDNEIIAVAKELGCEVPFVRPLELAGDEISGIAVIRHAVQHLVNEEGYQPDYVLTLQPTSPLRRHGHISKVLEKLIDAGADSVITVCQAEQSPYWMRVVGPDDRLLPFLDSGQTFHRRQELPKIYHLNGAVYASRFESVMTSDDGLGKDVRPLIMSRKDSIDIDCDLDFRLAEMLIRDRIDQQNE